MTFSLVILVLVLLFGSAAWIIPQVKTRRALFEVVDTFRAHRALSPGDAKTMEELGLRTINMLQGITGERDYRPRALEVLLEAGIAISDTDGKMYLSERALRRSKIAGRTWDPD
jgi:hypothetical protein